MAASFELGEILHDNCLSRSGDCQMAVALKQEVKVFEMNCDPWNISSEFSFSKYRIPAGKKVLDMDVGIRREDFQPEDGEQCDIADIHLDKTLNPKEITTFKVTSESFCKVAWSKKGTDHHERCLLACLQWDHRLFISRFLKKSSLAIEVVNLSDMLWKVRQENWGDKTSAPKAEKLSEYRKRKMSVAIVDMAWSDILCGNLQTNDEQNMEESPLKRQKVEALAEPKREPFTILATAQRDGSVILWQMKTPVTNESDVSIATEIDTNYHWPTSLCWLHCSKDFLAIGSLTGELALWQIKYKENRITAERVCDLWMDKDDMRIDHICWIACETNPSYRYLLAVKAQHLILFLLSIPTLEEDSESPIVLSHCIQTSLHTVSSSGLCSGPSFAISCSQDGSLQKIQPSYVNSELSMKVDLFETHPPIGPAHRGCALSVNGVYFSTVTHNHVTRSTNLTLRPFADEKTILEKIQDKTVPLCLKVDCLEWIRWQYIKNQELDFPWISAPGDLQGWLDEDGGFDEHRLQMKRYLLIFQHSKLGHFAMKKRQRVNYQSVVDGLAKKISECEEQLMVLNMCSALGKVTAEDVDELSVKMMCDWLRRKQTCFTEKIKERVEKILNHPIILNIKASQFHEVCFLCGEKIQFQDLWQDSCSNGHTWKRCNLTLLLCQVKTRSCMWCTSKSLYPGDEDGPWFRSLLRKPCTFCGGVYVH